MNKESPQPATALIKGGQSTTSTTCAISEVAL